MPKHFYHKGNFEYNAEVRTPYEVMMTVKDGVYTDRQMAFLSYMNHSEYYLKNYNPEHPEKDLSNILCMFTQASADAVAKITEETINIPDYYPWNNEDIPLEKYSEEVSRMIRKKQNQMLNEMYFRKESEKVLVQAYRNDMLLEAVPESYQKELYNVVILLRGDVRIIYSKNDSLILQCLDTFEKDTWYIDINPIYHLQTIRNSKKSSIDFKDPDVLRIFAEILK